MMRPMLINKGWNVCGCLMKLFAISTRYEQVHVFILDLMLLLNLIMCYLPCICMTGCDNSALANTDTKSYLLKLKAFCVS